ncbi:MAG TPA: cupin domain-containing protein [Abditibacteriaceae bacterium]|jgi:quercetin dioxygenase-like cupin family protein
MSEVSTQSAPRVVRLDDVTPVRAFGDCVWPLLSSDDTAGELELMVDETPPGGGPPFHVHALEDEVFFVQSGRFEFTVGTQQIEAKAGDFLFAPRQVPHTFRVASDEPSRMHILTLPGNFGKFFARCADCFQGEPDFARISAIAGEHGISFLPPEAAADYKAPEEVLASKYVAANGGECFELGGNRVRFLLSAQESAGRCAVIELTTPAGGGAAPHTHSHEDELFIIQDGEYEFQIGDRTERASAGTVVFAPRPHAHGFRVVSETPGRMNVVFRPAGFEDFFRRCYEDMKDTGIDTARLAQIGAEMGITPVAA